MTCINAVEFCPTISLLEESWGTNKLKKQNTISKEAIIRKNTFEEMTLIIDRNTLIALLSKGI